uniref:B2 bradykinin receptor n=1 Tax=Fundulus heteroclitus TaxID=8078 RepID=A0A3Q2QMD4_FUNHE
MLIHLSAEITRRVLLEVKLMEQIVSSTTASVGSEESSFLPIGPSKSPDSTEWEMIQTIIPPYILALSLLGLLLNSFVLAVFVAHKDRLTVAEIYLSNLALADFLLLCGLPFWAMYILDEFNWSYGDALCKLTTSNIVINFYTSIYSLVMISVDRYLALVKTMKARWLRRTLYAKIMCFVLWLLGLFLSLPTIIHRKVKFFEEYNTTSCILDYAHGSSWKLAHQILMNVLGFMLPILFIVFSSWNIIRALARRMENAAFHDFNDAKATVLVYAVTLLFLLCWAPFQVFTLLDTLCDLEVLDVELWSHTLDIGGQVSVYLAFLDSMLNPLLYVFSGQYFRRKVCAIYRRARHQRRGSDMTTFQRSVASTYVNRTEQIRPVVIFSPKDQIGR